MALTSRPVLLVLRALGIGDFLTGVPALRALRRARPEHQLALAAPGSIAPLARLSGAVDRLHVTAGLSDFVAPALRTDIAVNLHGKGPQSHRALALADPGELLAFACPSVGYAGPAWRADEHEVHRWCRLVSEGWSVEADPSDLRIQRPAHRSPAARSVVIHPGAAYPARRWPAERFAAVARWAGSLGHRVVVTGAPAEVPLAQRVRTMAGLGEDAVLAGDTDLAQLASLVAEARLVVCGDTGMAHLASAYSTPSVVLFGPTPPARWGPPADGPHVAIWHGSSAGDPWGTQVDAALLEIEVDEVLELALPLLGVARPTAQPEPSA